MNSKEQHRHATVNDRLDLLLGAVETLTERVETLEQNLETDVRSLTDSLTVQADLLRLSFTDLITAEHAGRVYADDFMESVHRAFMHRGFWSRFDWLLTGR